MFGETRELADCTARKSAVTTMDAVKCVIQEDQVVVYMAHCAVGAWDDNARNIRVSNPYSLAPDSRKFYAGLRCIAQ